MIKHVIAKIVFHKEVKKDCFRMVLEAPAIARQAMPGQFVHVRCGSGVNPLLRRPISLHRVKGKNIEVLFNVVGKGTAILAALSKGESVDVIGPMGNGFEIPAKKFKLYMLVGGGLGAAPLLSLADGLIKKKVEGRGTAVVLGAKSKEHILCEEDFKKLGAKVYIATDDGSKGAKGFATELAEEVMDRNGLKAEDVLIYAAGPIGMIRALCGKSGSCSAHSQISLEERMACGLGACRGCVIKTRNGYRSVCNDGPVFKIKDLLI